MYIARLLFFVAVWLGLSAQAQPLSTHPISTQSEVGFEPCRDTFHLFKRQEFYDIGVILPSWLPIVDKHYVAIVEEGHLQPQHGSPRTVYVQRRPAFLSLLPRF
ncbi:MAG: hypothetical protein IPH78_01090 [Bacteroidetes bacterium]|nr:hypothetical protein [Bacteroidota bacterium]